MNQPPQQMQLQKVLPNWSEFLSPQVRELLPKYLGTQAERQAQALRDMADSYAEKHELDGLVLGAILNEVRDRGLYKQLGYATIDEFLTCERVGNLGRSQCWVWMDVARVTAPPIAAPTLKAQVLNTAVGRPLLSPDFVAKAGITRTNAVVKKWSRSTPEQRQELIDSALNSSNKDFYETAYGNGQPKTSFSVTGDSIMLWRDDIGTLVARITSLDPQDRSELLDRLGIR